MTLTQRLASAIERYGDDCLLDGSAVKAVVTALRPESARRYLADAEVDTVRPLWLAHLAHDVSVATTDPFVWDGRNLTVRAVHELRARGERVARLAVVG